MSRVSRTFPKATDPHDFELLERRLVLLLLGGFLLLLLRFGRAALPRHVRYQVAERKLALVTSAAGGVTAWEWGLGN